MKKVKINYIIDVLAFFAIIIVGVTGILKFPNLANLLGIHPLPLGIQKVHDWAGMVLVGLMIIHIWLHWKWLITMTKHYFGKKK